MDPTTKKENLDRMYNEGHDLAKQLLRYVQTDTELVELSKDKKIKYIQTNKPEFATFISIYPIVSQYIIFEKVFDSSCFRKYITQVFGKDKTEEEKIFLAKDSKNVYLFKNRQYALYAKYLLQRFNPHMDRKNVDAMYNDMVDELNNETKKMFEIYDTNMKDVDQLDKEMLDSKRKDILNALKARNC